jgi:phage shock protein C
MAKQRQSDSLIWGIILIVIGIFFLLHQLDIRVWRYVWHFWPVILIVWGVNKLSLGLKERSERQKTQAPPQD